MVQNAIGKFWGILFKFFNKMPAKFWQKLCRLVVGWQNDIKQDSQYSQIPLQSHNCSPNARLRL